MKYVSEIEIALPREEVVELFDNVDNVKKWQPTLLERKHVSGEPNQPGAEADLLYQSSPGQTVQMTETIKHRNLPDEFFGHYATPGLRNELQNYFEEIDENSTRWIIKNNYKFSGVLKMMGIIAKKSFKDQTMKTMRQFKEFAEEHSAT